jgi:hypothetical protein
MSTTPNPGIPGLDPPSAYPSAPPARRRHALGLPAGSIRALLTCVVFGLLAAVMATGTQAKIPLLYNYLWYLLLLIIAHYFAAHGSSIGEAPAGGSHPWGLPRGTFRFLLIAGFVALVGWLWYSDQLYQPTLEATAAYPLVLLAGFFLGVFIARVVNSFSGAGGPPAWFQDIQAWLALMALLMLAGQVVILVFINPNVDPEHHIVENPTLEALFAGTVGFYFGARS